MGIIKEFKEFAYQGNVLDMAVGIIIGGAFGKIVSSFVADIVMPPIGVLLGGVDFNDIRLTVQKATAEAPAVTMNIGSFFMTVIDFLIVAAAIFMVVKAMNSAKKKEAAAPAAPPAPPAPTKEEVLLTEIRDALRAR